MSLFAGLKLLLGMTAKVCVLHISGEPSLSKTRLTAIYERVFHAL
jgi:hypothetical protein